MIKNKANFLFKKDLCHQYRHTNENINALITCIDRAIRSHIVTGAEHKLNEYFNIAEGDYKSDLSLFWRSYSEVLKEVERDVINMELFEYMAKVKELKTFHKIS